MPTYIYKAKKGPTEIIEGSLEADSQDHAIDQLSKDGLLTVSIRPKQASVQVKQNVRFLNITSARIGSQDIDVFTRQLASLVRAGVPILRL